MGGKCEFLYNSRDGCMGRHAGSWAKIGIFYLVFYSCLAGFFAGMLMLFFETMDETKPSQTGMDSLIKGNPGMAFRPMPKVSSTLIQFKHDEEDTYRKYVDNIEILLHKYTAEQANEDYSYQDCAGGADANADQPCKFDLSLLGTACTKENNYGYSTGQPCVLMKLNKIFDWVPEPYDKNVTDKDDKKSIPQELKDNYPAYEGNGVAVTCTGENFGDVDNLGAVEFSPASGFLGTFFPFSGQKGYQAPLVMVQLSNIHRGVLVQVYCKAWASNIYHHKNDKAGSMRFEVLVD